MQIPTSPTFLRLFILISFGFLTALTACTSTSSGKQTSSPQQSGGDKIEIIVDSCDSEHFTTLSTEAKTTMMEAGITKCSMPFGILIGADQNIDDTYVLKVAQIVAEMLDQDRNGSADDTALQIELQQWNRAWLAMPANQQTWETTQLPLLYQHLGYDIIVPTWWMGSGQGEPDTRAIQVMVEEVTHFITQFGWSSVYPEQFGVNNWSSVIAQETQSAQCDWWQHPENDCPDSPAEYPGECNAPSCDVVEFYHQVLIMRAGMTPGWLGIGFPETKEELEEKLSQQIKDIMDDPQYHQLKQPLQFDY